MLRQVNTEKSEADRHSSVKEKASDTILDEKMLNLVQRENYLKAKVKTWENTLQMKKIKVIRGQNPKLEGEGRKEKWSRTKNQTKYRK